LQRIGDAGHEMTVAYPPDQIDGPVGAEVGDELAKILGRHGRGPGVFACEGKGDLFCRTEARPVPAGEQPSALSDAMLIQARDREQHVAMAHSVKRLLPLRHQPEYADFEDGILVGLGPEGFAARRPCRGQSRLVGAADSSPVYVPSRFVRWKLNAWLPPALRLKALLQSLRQEIGASATGQQA
jgi:hypothetical protein